MGLKRKLSRNAAKGSIHELLGWLGMLGYGAYNYAYYMLGTALNTFFLLYGLLLLLSVVALILVLSRSDVANVAVSFRPKMPMRIIGGHLVFAATGLYPAIKTEGFCERTFP